MTTLISDLNISINSAECSCRDFTFNEILKENYTLHKDNKYSKAEIYHIQPKEYAGQLIQSIIGRMMVMGSKFTQGILCDILNDCGFPYTYYHGSAPNGYLRWQLVLDFVRLFCEAEGLSFNMDISNKNGDPDTSTVPYTTIITIQCV